jgi:hypothetical protein
LAPELTLVLRGRYHRIPFWRFKTIPFALPSLAPMATVNPGMPVPFSRFADSVRAESAFEVLAVAKLLRRRARK